MAEAERGGYAVGYFESWNLESLLAVADAAEAVRSPVILGFSGIYLPHPTRVARDPLGALRGHGRRGRRRADRSGLPPLQRIADRAWVRRGDRRRLRPGHVQRRRRSGSRACSIDPRRSPTQAHARGAAVEAELEPLAGVAGDLAPDAAGATAADRPRRGARLRRGDRHRCARRQCRPAASARPKHGAPRSRPAARARRALPCRWSCMAARRSTPTTSARRDRQRASARSISAAG